MWFAAACSLLALCVCLPLFFYYKNRIPPLGAGFKSAGTLCAAALSLVGTLQLNPVYGFFLAAQVLHAFADYCLEFHFGTGVLFFLLGHIC